MIARGGRPVPPRPCLPPRPPLRRRSAAPVGPEHTRLWGWSGLVLRSSRAQTVTLFQCSTCSSPQWSGKSWRKRQELRCGISSSLTTLMSRQHMTSPAPVPSMALCQHSSSTTRKCLVYSPDEGLIYGTRGRDEHVTCLCWERSDILSCPPGPWMHHRAARCFVDFMKSELNL